MSEHSAANRAVGRDMDKAIDAARTLAFDLEDCLKIVTSIETRAMQLRFYVHAVSPILGT